MTELLGNLHSLAGKALLGNMERSDAEKGGITRVLLPESVKSWKMSTPAAPSLTFEELHERVHKNDVANLDGLDLSALTVEEKEHLIMRATPLSVATANFAQQFGSSIAGDLEFKLSKPVKVCDDFLSHAWQTDRLSKWCALVYTYNFKASSAAWFFAHIIAVFLCAALAPQDRSTIGLGYQVMCFTATIVVPFCIQLTVLLHGVPSFFGTGNEERTVFLDKVCINQNHIGLKTLGINGLETFLKYSRRMVLLYDTRTYTRLWCAFESAMFSRFADVDNFVLCPCATSFYAIAMLFASHAAVIVASVGLLVSLRLRGWDSAEWFRAFESRDHLILYAEVLGAVAIPVYTFMAWLLRNRCREIISIQRSLETFRMADTQCFDPRDRELVEARIAEVWGKAEDFDKFVRERLASEMTGTIGAADLPPMWLDFVLCMAWLPLWTFPGLVQASDELPFTQFFSYTLLMVLVICAPPSLTALSDRPL